LILNFQFNLELIFTHKTLKGKEIGHDLNHDLIFYFSNNQLRLPRDATGTWGTCSLRFPAVFSDPENLGNRI
jgi:hypothetical protein